MFATRFLYHLTGAPEPDENDLDDEIDRLLCVKGVETPTYLFTDDNQTKQIDSEVLSLWIKRRFEPALLLLLFEHEDNYRTAKSELSKMEKFQSGINSWFRAKFVKKRAMQRVREMCFDDGLNLPQAVVKVKKTLTFLAHHLERNSPNKLTLLDTEGYTSADINLYNYLKRVVIGGYKDSGLRSHIRLCELLVQFMSRFATRNTYVLNVSAGDSLSDDVPQDSLLSDIVRPAMVALGFFIFYQWRCR